MNPLLEIGLLVARELRRSLRSAKGLVLLLICAMMAAGTALVVAGMEQSAQEAARHAKHGSAMALAMVGSEANRRMLEAAYDASVADRLSAVPRIVLTMMAGTIMFAPMFIAFLSFDSVSSEL